MFFDWRQSHARSRNRILLKSSPSPRPSCRIEQSQNGEITRSLGHVRQNCPAEPINNKNCREKEREREREREVFTKGRRRTLIRLLVFRVIVARPPRRAPRESHHVANDLCLPVELADALQSM